MADDLRDRIARLPAWARDYIRNTELRSEPAIEAAVKARRDLEVAQQHLKRCSDSNEALLELLRRAGSTGLDWAATVVSVLENYEIYQSSSDSPRCDACGGLHDDGCCSPGWSRRCRNCGAEQSPEGGE